MVNVGLLKNTKQLPWRSFPIHQALQSIEAKEFKTPRCQEALFTIHPDDQDKVLIHYNIKSPFLNPTESFPELSKLRSTKDFANFENIFIDTQLQALLEVKKNQKLSHPVTIKLPNQKNYQVFQYGIIAGENSFSTFEETYEHYKNKIEFNYISSTISVKKNAKLEFISENSRSHAPLSVRHMHNYLDAGSQLYLNYYSVEDSNTELPLQLSSLYNVHTFLVGKAANFFEQALILAKNQKNRQHYSNVYHLQAHGQSSQLHKSMLDDFAKSVFNSLVFISSDCPQVNSHQLNNNLSFSKKTKVISQPQLQVKTDDVKAGHGSTTGQVQAEELYYLQSRGISLSHAKKLLKQAFIKEVQSNIDNVTIKKSINNILESYDQ